MDQKPPGRRLTKLIKVGLPLLIAYLGFCIVAGVIVAEAVLHPSRQRLTSADLAQAPAWAKDDDAILANVSITAADGAVLRAWEVQAENGNGDAVIMLHGLRGNRMEMTNYA